MRLCPLSRSFSPPPFRSALSFLACLGLRPWPGYAAASHSLGPPSFRSAHASASGLGLAMRLCALSHGLGPPSFAPRVPRPLALAWLGGCVTQPRPSAPFVPRVPLSPALAWLCGWVTQPRPSAPFRSARASASGLDLARDRGLYQATSPPVSSSPRLTALHALARRQPFG